MARFSRMQILDAMYEISLVPVLYHGDFETPRNVVAPVSRGGCKLVEFVNRGALAMTTPGDTTMATRADVEKVMQGAGALVVR